MSVTSILLVGVGGQGTLLAGDVIARTAAASGQDVKLAEVHGMSQRGGSVDSVIRFGEEVHSPVIDPGGADHLVAFEVIEAARWMHYLSVDGSLLVNTRVIHPLPVLIGALPAPEGLTASLIAEDAMFVDADSLAREAGNVKTANLVMLGALSVGLPFEERTWLEVIESRVPPKTVELNLRAFDLGRQAVREGGVRQ